MDILKVQEIRRYEETIRIANAPAFIKRLINLRETIVPIIDMRIRFNLGKSVYDRMTVVIILNIGSGVVGMVIDAVSDVVCLGPEAVRAALSMGMIDMDYLLGIGTLGDRTLILMDVERLMASPDMGLDDLKIAGRI